MEKTTSTPIRVALDDGSGQMPFRYEHNGQTFTGKRPSAVHAGATSKTNGEVSEHAWIEGSNINDTGEAYTAAHGNSNINTCSPTYQTSGANRTLVIDTLANYAKLGDTPIVLGATLPVGKFFRQGTVSPDHVLIEQKRKNLMSPMINVSGVVSAPKIQDVIIYPEGIPVYYAAATEASDLTPDDTLSQEMITAIQAAFDEDGEILVADVGQFTTDLARLRIQHHPEGIQVEIIECKSSEFGVHTLHNSLRAEMAKRDIPFLKNPADISEETLNRTIDRGYYGSPALKDAQTDLSNEIALVKQELVERIRSDINSMRGNVGDTLMLIVAGGGANIIRNEVGSLHPLPFVPKEPDLMVVNGVHIIMNL